MAETIDLGYNTVVKVGDKTFAGVSQDELTLTPELKESITKADEGNRRTQIVRVGGGISVSGLCSTDSTATVLDRAGIIDMVLAKQQVEVEYKVGSTVYSGTGNVSSYRETTPADPNTDPTYTLDINLPNGLEKES